MTNILLIADAERSIVISRCFDGMTVCSVVEAWEAIEALATQTIHAVVIDHDRIEEAGWRVVENILDEGDDVVVILLAANASLELRRNARRLGVVAVVDPHRLTNLRGRVCAALALGGDHSV